MKALENPIDGTNLRVEEFGIAMETTAVDASWINGNNERHNRTIHNMVIAYLIGINSHEKNGVVQKKHRLKYIDTKYIVH